MVIFITFAVVVFLLIAIVTMSMVVRYRKHQRKLGLMTGMYLIMILKALLIYMYIDTCSNSCNGFFVNIFVRTYVHMHVYMYVCILRWCLFTFVKIMTTRNMIGPQLGSNFYKLYMKKYILLKTIWPNSSKL